MEGFFMTTQSRQLLDLSAPLLADLVVPQYCYEVLAIQELSDEQIESMFSDELSEGILSDVLSKTSISKLLKTAGLHAKQSKGLIHYLLDAGKGLAQLFIAAIRGDEDKIKEIMSQVTKEQVLDFLLKIDTATLHLVTGPIHLIDAVTGWHIGPHLKDIAKNADQVAKEVSNALKSLISNVSKLLPDPKQARIVIQRITSLQTLITGTTNAQVKT